MELGSNFCVVVAQHRVGLLSSDLQCLLLSGLRGVQTIWATLMLSHASRLDVFFFKMSSIDTEHCKASWAGPGNPANRFVRFVSWISADKVILAFDEAYIHKQLVTPVMCSWDKSMPCTGHTTDPDMFSFKGKWDRAFQWRGPKALVLH